MRPCFGQEANVAEVLVWREVERLLIGPGDRGEARTLAIRCREWGYVIESFLQDTSGVRKYVQEGFLRMEQIFMVLLTDSIAIRRAIPRMADGLDGGGLVHVGKLFFCFCFSFSFSFSSILFCSGKTAISFTGNRIQNLLWGYHKHTVMEFSALSSPSQWISP